MYRDKDSQGNVDIQGPLSFYQQYSWMNNKAIKIVTKCFDLGRTEPMYQRKKVVTLLAICFSLCIFSPSIHADELYLRNGSIIKGKILEIKNNESYRILLKDGSEIVYQADEVDKVKLMEDIPKESLKINQVPQKEGFRDPSPSKPIDPQSPDIKKPEREKVSSRDATTPSKTQQYVKNGWYLGAQAVRNTMKGDFDDSEILYRESYLILYSGIQEIIVLPKLESGTGFRVFFGKKTKRLSTELSYQRTTHDANTIFLDVGSFGKTEAVYNVIDYNLKIDLLEHNMIRPYVRFGFGYTWMTLKDCDVSEYSYDDVTFPPKTRPCSRRVQIANKEEGARHEKQEVLDGTDHSDIEGEGSRCISNRSMSQVWDV